MVGAVTDVIVLGALLLSFATVVVAHVAIAFKLLWRKQRYRGIVALVIPPLAPWWAYSENWRRWCWLWVGAVLAYTAALTAASL